MYIYMYIYILYIYIYPCPPRRRCPADHVLRMHYAAGTPPSGLPPKLPLRLLEHSALRHPASPAATLVIYFSCSILVSLPGFPPSIVVK